MKFNSNISDLYQIRRFIYQVTVLQFIVIAINRYQIQYSSAISNLDWLPWSNFCFYQKKYAQNLLMAEFDDWCKPFLLS